MKTDQIYDAFKIEAERFYVSQFIDSEKIERTYKEAIKLVCDRNAVQGAIAYHSKYGQGKTFLFNVLHSLYKKEKNINIYKRTSSKELTELFKSQGEEELSKFIDVKNLFIDDIGAEVKDGSAITKNYGNSMNVIEYVIFKRYELWEAKGWKLHATTNIDLNQISKIYGGRVADRLVQMCKIIEFDLIKTSFRQVSKVRQLTQHEKDQNLEKYYPKPKEVIQKVDMIKFLNDLITEDEKQILHYDIHFWTFIRKYLERNELIEYSEITDKHLDTAETLARQSIRNTTNAAYKNIIVADREKKAAYDRLDYKGLMLVAKNAQVRAKFIQMKNDNTKFKQHEEN